MPILELSIDELLSTTRSVRKRLDLTRPGGAGGHSRMPLPGRAGSHSGQYAELAFYCRHRTRTA